MPGYAFISYSRVDGDFVRSLALDLERRGISTWYDYEIEVGDQFARRIEKAIDQCAAFILILSPASEKSTWVRVELARAKRLGKPILPMLLRPTAPLLEIEGIQIEDVTGARMPRPAFTARLSQLVSSNTSIERTASFQASPHKSARRRWPRRWPRGKAAAASP
jgi:hypothetical protein